MVAPKKSKRGYAALAVFRICDGYKTNDSYEHMCAFHVLTMHAIFDTEEEKIVQGPKAVPAGWGARIIRQVDMPQNSAKKVGIATKALA